MRVVQSLEQVKAVADLRESFQSIALCFVYKKYLPLIFADVQVPLGQLIALPLWNEFSAHDQVLKRCLEQKVAQL